MLDVHPPHHAANSWRDFFIHIATIVVGLLIAVGLEQMVEAIHHRHQRQHLEQALAEDLRKQVDDALILENAMNAEITAITGTIAQVHAAAVSHIPLASVMPIAYPDGNTLSNPASTAARSSGLLSVLKEEDVRANGENDTVVDYTNSSGIFPWFAAYGQLQQFQLLFRLRPAPDSPLDFSSATSSELERYSVLLGNLLAASIATRSGAQYARGVARAILNGERDLSRIQTVELPYVTPVGTPPVP